MFINGTISTNSQPSISSIITLAKQSKITATVCKQQIRLKIENISFAQNIKCTLTTSANAVKYRCFITELTGYPLVFAVAMMLLYRTVSLTLWIAILTAITVTVIIAKIYFDRRIRKIVDTLIPHSVKLVPELARKEHVEWINNPSVCSACGAPVNKYFTRCHSCDIRLPNHETIRSNTDISSNSNQKIKYHYTTCEK